MRSTLNGVILTLAGLLLLGATATGQDDKKALIEEMRGRYPTIQTLKLEHEGWERDTSVTEPSET